MNLESLSSSDKDALIIALMARIAELERRLGLNSSNSGKPPSSDGLKKGVRVKSLREPSDRPSGGQKGHKGETLRQSGEPDDVVDHFPAACGRCGTALTPDMAAGHIARQVFDLAEPQPMVVTEHRAHDCLCAACGAITRGAFPDDVTAPVQYGARIAAFVVYLLHAQFVPENRVVKLMADLFGINIAAATVAGMSRNCAERLQGFVGSLRDLVAGAPVKHMDETGLRIGGKTNWLHVASTASLTFYRACRKRGELMANVAGIVVHDHWKPYYTMPGVQHALCNAHHLRELKALVEIEKEDWARKIQQLLRRACHAVNLAHRDDGHLSPWLIACFERRYDAIVKEGIAFHEAEPFLDRPVNRDGKKKRGAIKRRTGHNLLLRLQTRKDDVLRFLSNPDVPFTNNLGEQDIRMMKVRQKVSGGFRSDQGAKDFASIRSVLSTARKQGWNILEVLMGCPEQWLKLLRI